MGARRRITRKSFLRLAAGTLFGASAGRLIAGQATTAADIAKAKQEGSVMLYMSLDAKIAESIIKPFKEKNHIDVKYYRASSPAVMAKVLQEADAGRIQADIVDAGDVTGFITLKKRGVLKPYDSPVIKSIPAVLRDPDNAWVADRITQDIVEYNTKLVTGNDVPRH